MSGHYRPWNDQLRYALAQLRARGADISQAKAVNLVMNKTKKGEDKLEGEWFMAADSGPCSPRS
jgi:hypothetical protein